MKLGPFSAAFEGEAQVTPDPATHSGHVEGKGTDKRGGSRSKLVLDYRLAEVPGGTKVDVDADVQLVGPIAQFGRTGIVNETANVLIRQFVQNVEAKLAAMPDAATSAASATTVTTRCVNGVCPHLHPRRLRPWRCRPLRKGHRVHRYPLPVKSDQRLQPFGRGDRIVVPAGVRAGIIPPTRSSPRKRGSSF